MPASHESQSDTTSDSIKTSKDSLRKILRDTLTELPPHRRAAAADSAATGLSISRCWGESESILGYLAFGAELDADGVLEEALNEGKYVYVPRISAGELIFHRILSLKEEFSRGPFGIREPREKAPRWNLSTSPGPVLVLVPGLGFDRHGARLGRGAGYYDRFISRVRREAADTGKPAPVFLGYAYQEQIRDSIPTARHDEMLDGLITDQLSELF